MIALVDLHADGVSGMARLFVNGKTASHIISGVGKDQNNESNISRMVREIELGRQVSHEEMTAESLNGITNTKKD